MSGKSRRKRGPRLGDLDLSDFKALVHGISERTLDHAVKARAPVWSSCHVRPSGLTILMHLEPSDLLREAVGLSEDEFEKRIRGRLNALVPGLCEFGDCCEHYSVCTAWPSEMVLGGLN